MPRLLRLLVPMTLVLSLLLPSLPAQAAAFKDVPSSFWGAQAIYALAQKGILNGVGGGYFQPNAPMTREQFATVLVRSKGLTVGNLGPPFSDVSTGNFYTPYIETAAGNGLMVPISPTTFAPTATVTRLEAAQSIVLYLGLDRVAGAMTGASLSYQDASQIDPTLTGVVKLVSDLGLLTGYSGKFWPQSPLTRAQLATILYRAMNLPQTAIQAEAAKVASSIYLGPVGRNLNVGQTMTLYPYVHDKALDVIPSSVVLTAQTGHIQGRTYTALTPGTDVITATVPGTTVKKTLSVKVYQPTLLHVSMPQTVAANSSAPVEVDVQTSTGTLDPADSGRKITLTYTGPATGTVTLTDVRGAATGSLTLPVPGSYQFQAQATGLTVGQDIVTALSAPVGSFAMGLSSTAVAGTSTPIQITNPGTVPVPLTISVTGPGSFTASESQAAPGISMAGNLSYTGVGTVTVTAQAPGGAALATTQTVQAAAAGTLLPLTPEGQGQAGQPITLSFGVVNAMAPTDGTQITLTPIAPNNSNMKTVTGTLQSGNVSFTFTPIRAGDYTFQLSAPTLAIPSLPQVTITAGPAQGFAATLTPSPVLPDGQTASVVASLVDTYGNPVPGPFAVKVAVLGNAAGSLQGAASSLMGLGTAATFTATATTGTTTLVVSSPDHPQYATDTLVVRDVAQGKTGVLAGQGLWLAYWDWKGVSDAKILSDCQAYGVTSLYLEIATSNSNGFYGGPGLDDLVQKAHADGIALFAWIYPDLSNPTSDLAFTKAVLGYTSPLGAKVDGIAMDLEENMTPQAIGSYAQAVRQAAGPQTLLIGVTYPPQQMKNYPFSSLGPYVDAIEPMDYWHTTETDMTYNTVYTFITQSIQTITQSAAHPGILVDPIAQTFDIFNNEGPYNPTESEVEGAIMASMATGANGISFYRYGTLTPDEWQALIDYPFAPPPSPTP